MGESRRRSNRRTRKSYPIDLAVSVQQPAKVSHSRGERVLHCHVDKRRQAKLVHTYLNPFSPQRNDTSSSVFGCSHLSWRSCKSCLAEDIARMASDEPISSIQTCTVCPSCTSGVRNSSRASRNGQKSGTWMPPGRFLMGVASSSTDSCASLALAFF